MKATKRSLPEFRSACPVATALDLVGDKWMLIVLRTILAGRQRFGEIADIPERIATNILADRLEKLERYGLVERRRYEEHPPRYTYALTPMGADLLPVLQGLAAWSTKHIPGRWPSPAWFVEGRPEHFYPDSRRTSA